MINFDELFKNHQATRVDCGPLSIITYKKPDSFEHGLRYIFDNELSTLTITGDWLKAVAVNGNNMGSPDRLYNSAYEPHFGVCRYGDYECGYADDWRDLSCGLSRSRFYRLFPGKASCAHQ